MRLTAVRPLELAVITIFLALPTQAQTVFINELHYDNDPPFNVEEFVEIAGPAGTDLKGWKIVFYNGANGAMYGTEAFTELIPDLCGGYGVVAHDRDVIQPGSPDGLALVDDSGGGDVVVQFLSYEGAFMATDGPANGMTSTDIGTGQSSQTPFGHSLQVVGAGMTYTDFFWAPPAANTKGACNAGQSFGAPQPSVYLSTNVKFISETGGETSIIARLTEAVAFDVTVALGFGGTATGPGQDYSVGGTEIVIRAGQLFSSVGLTGLDDNEVEQNETVDVDILSVTAPINIAAPSQLSFTISSDDVPGPSNMLINEVDADQTGTDDAEFVELFDGGGGNTALDGLALVLFNGSGRQAYMAWDLDGFSTDGDGYFVVCNDAANVPNCDLDAGVADNMIQNGPDAVALYAADATNFPNGTVISGNNVIDGFVYDTNDADTQDLWVILNPGQPQVNEDETGFKDKYSNQRVPNGSGGARNTVTYTQAPPTPGAVNAPPPTNVSLSLDKIQVGENGGDVVLTAELSEVLGADVTVMLDYSGTATGLGDDYSISSQDIVIAAGNTEGTVTISVLEDVDDEPNETVIITATGATSGVALGFPSEVTLTILDNDAGSTFVGYLRDDAINTHESGVTLNEISARSSNTDFNADGVTSSQNDLDEFIEIVNNGPAAIDINGWTLGDNNNNFMFSGLDPVVRGSAVVVFTRGAEVSNFDPGAGNQAVSVADLALEDDNDIVGLKNQDGVYIAAHWGESAPGNQLNGAFLAGATLAMDDYKFRFAFEEGRSITRLPDYTGIWLSHSKLLGTHNWSVDGLVELTDPLGSPGREESGGMVLDTEEVDAIPERISLQQNYPNPFNPVTTIPFILQEVERVRLTVTDLLGREVATLIDDIVPPGEHRVSFDASDLSSGIYLYKLKAGNTEKSNRMVLLR